MRQSAGLCPWSPNRVVATCDLYLCDTSQNKQEPVHQEDDADKCTCCENKRRHHAQGEAWRAVASEGTVCIAARPCDGRVGRWARHCGVRSTAARTAGWRCGAGLLKTRGGRWQGRRGTKSRCRGGICSCLCWICVWQGARSRTALTGRWRWCTLRFGWSGRYIACLATYLWPFGAVRTQRRSLVDRSRLLIRRVGVVAGGEWFW